MIAMKAASERTFSAAVRGRDGWVMEPKLDGHRIIATVEKNRVRIFTGGGREKSGKLPHVEAEVRAAFPVGVTLDGEAVASGGKTAGWGTVQSVMGSGSLHPSHREISFVVFDMLAHGGLDVTGAPLDVRREALEESWPDESKHLILCQRLPASQKQFDKLLADGYEGAVLKRRSSLYYPGRRSPDWIKVKGVVTADVVVMGFTPGNAGFAGFIGSVIFGQYKSGRLIERGRASGMDWATRTDMTKNKSKWVGRTIEISYNGHVGGEAFRHPQYVRVRDDKKAVECKWD